MSAHETTDNFWQIWNSFSWPDPQPVSYRLYYRSDGSADFYTMEDLPGDFIEVTKEVYLAAPYHARVINGQLKIDPVRRTIQQLVPGQISGTPCDPRDVCVVVADVEAATYWDLQQHEIS